MPDLRPYRLSVLLNPQASRAEREAVESFVKTWAQEHHGTVDAIQIDEGRKLAYEIAHHLQPIHVQARVSVPPDSARELADRLRLERGVLRARLWSGAGPSGKRLKDVPTKKPETAPVPAKKPTPAKEKVPLEKLEEKIEEILGEEVL